MEISDDPITAQSAALTFESIRWLRELRGLSQRELASLTGIAQSEIQRIERNEQECRLSSFVRICAALGAPAGWVSDLLIQYDPARFNRLISDDPGFLVLMESLGNPDKPERERLVFDLMAACALTLILLHVSAPLPRARFHHYPTEEWKKCFLEFAQRLEDPTQATDRAALRLQLMEKPIATLQRLGLLCRPSLELKLEDSKRPKIERECGSFGGELYGLTFNEVGILLGVAQRGQTNNLTKTATSSKSSDVKPKDLWPSLKRELQTATNATTGAKTALAEYLGVELTRVSQWLSDSKKTAREPGAEYALLMQAWLNDPRRAK